VRWQCFKVALRIFTMFADNTKYPVDVLIQRHAVALADCLIHDSAPVGDGQAVALDPFGAVERAVVAILFEVCFGAGATATVSCTHT